MLEGCSKIHSTFQTHCVSSTLPLQDGSSKVYHFLIRVSLHQTPPFAQLSRPAIRMKVIIISSYLGDNPLLGVCLTEFRTSVPGGFINSQWETCQASGEQCLLDFANTSNLTPISGRCDVGSVPSYFVCCSSTLIRWRFLMLHADRCTIIRRCNSRTGLYKKVSSTIGDKEYWSKCAVIMLQTDG